MGWRGSRINSSIFPAPPHNRAGQEILVPERARVLERPWERGARGRRCSGWTGGREVISCRLGEKELGQARLAQCREQSAVRHPRFYSLEMCWRFGKGSLVGKAGVGGLLTEESRGPGDGPSYAYREIPSLALGAL